MATKIKLLKALKICFTIFLSLFLIICLACVVLFKFSGFSYYIIRSGSMTPDINVDDVVVCKDLMEQDVPDEIHVGDIATYYDFHNNAYITHRVYETAETDDGETLYLFKGDNNNTVDRYSVKASQIRGKYVMTISGFGSAFEYFTSYGGIVFMILVLITLILFDSLIGYFLKEAQKKQEETMSENSEADSSDQS